MVDIWMDVDIAIAEAPVNIMPLIDDTDFKTIEAAVVYNAAGMALKWHFVTTAGVMTETAVTPTTAGVHDWTDQGTSGLYALEIPASAGTINNDTEGFGWFSGVATGVLPWRGPIIGFRAAALNNAMIDGGDVLDVSLTEIGGVAQSATDLKDFADEGYDPATNKVQGVVLTDTTTTNTDTAATLGTPTDTDIATDLANIQSDTDDVQTRIPAALVSGKMNSDATAISGSATAADNLEDSALTIVLGAAEGSPTTTNIPSDLTEATVDHYKGRVLIFVDGAVAGQATDITAYAADGAMTVTALTNAPAAADKFVIV